MLKMFCLDKSKMNTELAGTINDKKIIAIDIRAIPCASKPASDRGIACNEDKQKAMKYLDDANLIMFYNRGEFRSAEFSQTPIAKTTNRHSIKI